MVVPSFYPVLGGSETIVNNFSVKLNQMGIQTDIMTFNMNQRWKPFWKGKTVKINGINVFKIPALNWLPVKYKPRMKFRVNLIPGRFGHLLKNYEIIHFHDDGDLTIPLFSYLIKKPKIFHLHGFYFEYYRKYFLSRYILKNVAHIYIALTKNMINDLSRLGIPKRKIRQLPNGVDVHKFRPSKEKKDDTLLYVGRISRTKGIHVLIKSLKYLKSSVNLVIVGPPDWEFEKIQGLINKEKRKGIHKILYLGRIKTSDLIKWYQRASIFVHPSLFEIFPVTDLEALSCETPVVATKVGGIPEIVRDKRNGILVPPNDPIKFAEAVQYLLDNKRIRQKFGVEGRKWVIKNFSMESVIKKLCRIYKEMID
jgi:glycosyltransferase involved in cell wall biosynthesis